MRGFVCLSNNGSSGLVLGAKRVKHGLQPDVISRSSMMVRPTASDGFAERAGENTAQVKRRRQRRRSAMGTDRARSQKRSCLRGCGRVTWTLPSHDTSFRWAWWQAVWRWCSARGVRLRRVAAVLGDALALVQSRRENRQLLFGKVVAVAVGLCTNSADPKSRPMIGYGSRITRCKWASGNA